MVALRALNARQKRERLAFGPTWIDTGLIAVNEDGSPIRPETYSKAFRRHCATAGVAAIRLHDTGHTAATRMLDSGTTVSATAKWLGHDPAMTLRGMATSTKTRWRRRAMCYSAGCPLPRVGKP